MASPFRNLFITTDFSQAADRALTVGFELARSLGARVTLCHVIELVVRPNPLFSTYTGVDKQAATRRHEMERNALLQLEARVPEDLRGQVATVVREGTPADEILQAAADTKADLVVLAPHGSTGLLDRLMGGTAYRVVRHAHCPVLVVR